MKKIDTFLLWLGLIAMIVGYALMLYNMLPYDCEQERIEEQNKRYDSIRAEFYERK
ncbi:hypothetical protein [Halobacillus litoralis]|uniref:hypothetical protein n=1 Tax=Halobacillus litoralis TaxID=45668 RepID=UPI00249388AC|nr:hypothetical protein [Halobacillus litoralis]